MKNHILIVDDEKKYFEVLNENLEEYKFSYASNIGEAQKALEKNKIDLILMDWNLGEECGLELVKELKKTFTTLKIPVVMLTANKEETDVVKALDSGADDFISKPFTLDLLLSKVKANLRKYGLNNLEKQIFFKDIHLDENNFAVNFKNKRVLLRRKEFMMFKFMLLEPDKCYTREELNEKTTGKDVFVSKRTIDTLIRYLRTKLGEDSIKTVHGQGYKLNVNFFN